MRSIAIIRATDILKLKSTLTGMTQAGLTFEGKPKEINPASIEKTLSKVSQASDIIYEICALVSIAQEYEVLQNAIKNLPLHSNVLVLDASVEPGKSFIKLIPILPDLDIPDIKAQTRGSRGKSIYFDIFVNRKIQIQTFSGTIYTGILKHADSIGILFEPSNNSAPVFITWHDIKKVVIPKEKNK